MVEPDLGNDPYIKQQQSSNHSLTSRVKQNSSSSQRPGSRLEPSD